ncbi:MAG: M28 family peptidase [Blastocatellia bacterium]
MIGQSRLRHLFAHLALAGLLLPALAPGASFGYQSAPTAASAFSEVERAAAAAVSTQTITEVTNLLASREMEGRGTGQPGADRAAKYIADRFARLGLKPGGDGGAYLQPIKFKVEQSLPESAFKAGDTSFAYNKDFVVAPPLPAASTVVSGELAFVGYGVASADLKRDDLEGVDFKGKVVVLLGGKPKNVDQAAWSKAASPQAVLGRLVAGGAAGFVLTYVPARDTQPFNLVMTYLSRRRVALADAPQLPLKLPPMVMISDATAEKLFAGSGSTYAEARQKAETGEFVSRALAKRASISVKLRREEAMSSNVAAVLEGSDAKLKDEAVVLCAHYDAYGIDTDGTIYPGAADNAIGVAKLVAIAEALVKSKTKLRRSIIFLAVTGEEYGLLGAAYWVKHPTWPIEKVAANINYDGIGTEVWGPLGYIIDYGFKHSDLGELLDGVLAAQGLRLVPDPSPEEGIFNRSDHYEFFKKGVPALYLIGAPAGNLLAFMPRAAKWLVTDYHMATDTVQPDWNWEGARGLSVTGMIAAMRIANQDSMPAWKASSPYNRPRGTELPPPPRQ